MTSHARPQSPRPPRREAALLSLALGAALLDPKFDAFGLIDSWF
jgi:hypothetical protein